MDSKIILGRIIQRLIDQGYAQVSGYNRFNLLEVKNNHIKVDREQGHDTSIYFNKIINGIDAYQSHPELYNDIPTRLRDFGISHVTSPIYALLHLLKKEDYVFK